MIAVVEDKYKGVKTLEPEKSPDRVLKRATDRLSEEQVAIIDQMLREPVQFVDNPMFHDRSAAKELEEDILAGTPEMPHAQAKLIPIELFDEMDKAVTSFQSLTQQEESRLFLKINYCRFKIFKILKNQKGKALTLTASRELLEWKGHELHIRSLLTQANIPLVLAMAKRTRPTGVDFSELISEGNMALLRSIDKFDCARGFKFSTYACRAILKSFSRASLKMSRYRGRFPVEFDPDLERGDVMETCREDTEGHCVDRIRDVLSEQSEALSDIERQVLRARFAIREDEDESGGPMTLEEVGRIIGVTKERVRQIQNKALAKLRVELEETVLAS